MSNEFNPDQVFAANVKARREKAGWKQADLLRALHNEGHTGFHQTTLSRIESGHQPARLGEAIAISAALGVKVSTLLAPEETFESLQDFERDVAEAMMHLGTLAYTVNAVLALKETLAFDLPLAEAQLKAMEETPALGALDTKSLLHAQINNARHITSVDLVREVESIVDETLGGDASAGVELLEEHADGS